MALSLGPYRRGILRIRRTCPSPPHFLLLGRRRQPRRCNNNYCGQPAGHLGHLFKMNTNNIRSCVDRGMPDPAFPRGFPRAPCSVDFRELSRIFYFGEADLPADRRTALRAWRFRNGFQVLIAPIAARPLATDYNTATARTILEGMTSIRVAEQRGIHQITTGTRCRIQPNFDGIEFLSTIKLFRAVLGRNQHLVHVWD